MVRCCAIAAATCTVGIIGAIVLCFNSASREAWLIATPDLMASMARCESQPTRSRQVQCKQSVIATRLAPDLHFAQLARR